MRDMGYCFLALIFLSVYWYGLQKWFDLVESRIGKSRKTTPEEVEAARRMLYGDKDKAE